MKSEEEEQVDRGSRGHRRGECLAVGDSTSLPVLLTHRKSNNKMIHSKVREIIGKVISICDEARDKCLSIPIHKAMARAESYTDVSKATVMRIRKK
ncbi:hypothetical protein PR048_006328 [Dryococelus australis]|uniref:Uncharacterized protein n=1 Tax=Dryococelus australis TaxID=614101 RepID=A0ABQ9IAT6_9NEOP|nr:hypothetical protein PR048_006328 [Dryococelus australis]